MQARLLADDTWGDTPGDISFCDSRGDGTYRWLHFVCFHGQTHRIALEPQRQSNGASWVWDGNKERPTLQAGPQAQGKRSVEALKYCGCHFTLDAGQFNKFGDSR